MNDTNYLQLSRRALLKGLAGSASVVAVTSVMGLPQSAYAAD